LSTSRVALLIAARLLIPFAFSAERARADDARRVRPTGAMLSLKLVSALSDTQKR